MGFYTSLADNLRRCGVKTIEIDGWKTRGSSSFAPRGSCNHHTAGPAKGAAPSLNICINGRTGSDPVPGPLCNVHGGRDLIARVVAAGRANHAGKGGWRGLSGNSSCFGLEAEHSGYPAKEPITAEFIDFMARIQAAFCLTGGYDESWIFQHWEWTTRKVDFCKGALDPGVFRQMVGNILRQVKSGKVTPDKIVPSTWKKGDKSCTVAAWQQSLNVVRVEFQKAGRIQESGTFGDEMFAAVVEFQKFSRAMQQMAGEKDSSKLLTVDGVIGPQTGAALTFWAAIAETVEVQNKLTIVGATYKLGDTKPVPPTGVLDLHTYYAMIVFQEFARGMQQLAGEKDEAKLIVANGNIADPASRAALDFWWLAAVKKK